MTVYIPTRSRPANVRKIVPRWLDQNQSVRLVVDPDEVNLHLALRAQEGWGSDVRVWAPPGVRGIGAIRRKIVRQAARNGLTSIILSEDDAMPERSSDFNELLDWADRPDVLGIGATRPIHDRFTGGAISYNSGAILCPGGWGFVCFGLNVQNALAAGNYDAALHTIGDDAELARNGIAKLRIPWLAHCDVRWSSLGTRYSPGGIGARFGEDLTLRHMAERECLALIHERWPDYTNEPDKRLRVAWAKMLDHYLPGWKQRSAIHGGDLKNAYWEEGMPNGVASYAGGIS